MIDAAFKELRKETRRRISVFKDPRTINCWEVKHRHFSDLIKRQTNADELGDSFFRQDILYVLWKDLKLHEMYATPSCVVFRQKYKFTFTVQNKNIF